MRDDFKKRLFEVLTEFQAETHQTAIDKGWYDPALGEVKTFLAELALVHSELSEAAEEYRNDTPFLYILPKDNHCPSMSGKPEGIAAEFADAIIRLFDIAEHRGIPLVQALIDKAEYNKTRPMRHGGKKC